MVAEKFEDTLVATMLAASGVLAQPYATDLLVTTRKGITKSLVTGLANPNAFLLSPYDWETIELLKDGTERFYFNGPQGMAQPMLWSRPVTQNVAMTQGTGLVGDFKQVKVWDRGQTQVFSTDSHADFFIRSISVMLCVMRAAIGIRRPAALTELDLTP